MIVADHQLGFSVCTTGDCSEGDVQIETMKGAFAALSANGQIDTSRFQSQVSAITSARDSYSWAVGYIPFNPSCCAIRDLGRQAQDLTKQMYNAANVPAPADVLEPHADIPVPDVSNILSNVLLTVGILGVVGVGVYAGFRIYGARKLTRSSAA